MTNNFRALCAELIASWDADGCDWKPQHQARWEATVNRARAELAEPEPEGPSDEELEQWYKDCADETRLGAADHYWAFEVPVDYANDLARAVLAHWGNPAPQLPADGEVVEVVERLRTVVAAYKSCRNTDHIWSLSGNGVNARLTVTLLTRAAELLQRQVLVPVSVSERLPGPEDCAPWPQPSDKSGWCWMSRTVHGFYGSFAIWEQVSVVPMCREVYTHWLPAHALPLPEVGA